MIDLILLVLAKLLLGWLLADVIGGFLHWIEDRVLREDMPWLGRTVVAPNRLHHVSPMAFAAGSFVHRNGATWIAAGIGSLIWLALFGASWIWIGATIGGLVTSMVHYLTHVPPPQGQARSQPVV